MSAKGQTPRPARIGRPPLPPEQRAKPHTIRMRDDLWAKVERNGGAQWLADLVARARER